MKTHSPENTLNGLQGRKSDVLLLRNLLYEIQTTKQEMAEKTDGREIIDIKNQIVNQFGKSEWLELGYTLGCEDIINNHGRLLRSLSFGDDDYEGNVLEVLKQIIDKDAKNLQGIKDYLAHTFSQDTVSEFISTAHLETPKRLISFSPQVFSIPAKPVNEKLVAVMIPYKKEFDETFETIKKSCALVGLECLKANDIWENSTFIQDVFELIYTSKIVIGDFTGKNPNVFYEIGIAHTLGKTVIPITQSISDVPTDLGHHRALQYLSNTEGYKKLEEDLSKRLNTLTPKKELDW